MTEYIDDDYMDCDYVDGNNCEQIELVKTFGFSQKDGIELSASEAQKLKNNQNKKYGRNSFVFPVQIKG